MHEEEVVTVVLQTHVMADAGGHRYGRHASIADEGIDLLVLRQEKVHYLDEAYSTGSCYGKGKGTNGEDKHRVQREELTCLRRAANCQTKQHYYDIVQSVASSLSQAGCLTTLFQQITEEEHTQQRQCRRHDKGSDEQSDDGEDLKAR